MRAAYVVAAAGSLAALLLVCRGPAAPQQPKPKKSFQCHWTNNKIKIDGVLNDIAWDNAEVIELTVPWEKRPAKTATKARLLWDKQYLYFSAEMEDHDLFADVKEPNGITWENDVFELFFKPDEKKLAYHEFQVNAANTPMELFLPSRGAGGYRRFASQTEVHIESAVKLSGTLNDWKDRDKGWVVEGRIPWEAFKPSGGRPQPGDKWRFALCRYDYSVTLERPELSTCAPLTERDFHRYEDYAELVFMDKK
jgi:hypothetical protein